MKISRLYIALSISILLLAGTLLMAEPASFTTAGDFNGRMWQLLSSSQKASHLTGIQEMNNLTSHNNYPQFSIV